MNGKRKLAMTNEKNIIKKSCILKNNLQEVNFKKLLYAEFKDMKAHNPIQCEPTFNLIFFLF